VTTNIMMVEIIKPTIKLITLHAEKTAMLFTSNYRYTIVNI
jgi:hypothetical protein